MRRPERQRFSDSWVATLRGQHPDWTLREIAEAIGGVTVEAVRQRLVLLGLPTRRPVVPLVLLRCTTCSIQFPRELDAARQPSQDVFCSPGCYATSARKFLDGEAIHFVCQHRSTFSGHRSGGHSASRHYRHRGVVLTYYGAPINMYLVRCLCRKRFQALAPCMEAAPPA